MIGLGLIGGSMLHALAAAGHRVTGYDADPATRAAARAQADRTAAARAYADRAHAHDSAPADHTAPAEGSADRWKVADTVRAAVAEAGLVVLAVPLPAVAGVLAELVEADYAGLLTDVTSVKTPVRELVRDRMRWRGHPGGVSRRQRPGSPFSGFVGGHPMAGRETSGFAAADPDLFRGCAWVLCLEPEPEPTEGGLAGWLELAALITGIGARVVPATAAEHDRAVAGVSHVPHLLAVALAATTATDPLAAALAAGSFRDGTRVAASPPGLIAAMCGGNAAAVGPALDAVLDALHEAREALRAPDPATALRPWLVPGTAARSGWPPRPGPEERLPARADALLDLGRAGGWVTSVAQDRRTVTAVRPVPPGPAGSSAGP